MERRSLHLLARFRSIDHRWIALATIIVLAIPMVIPVSVKMIAFPATKAMKAAIDAVPADKAIVLAADWDSGTRGECGPQMAAIIDYLFRSNRKFAIFGFIPQGPELTDRLCEELGARYGKKYGVDWVNWGYRPNYVNTLMAMMNDIPGTLKNDIKKNDLRGDAITKMLPSLKAAGLLIEITGTRLTGVYIQFCPGVPLAFGCTAVSGPDLYPYLQSGQAQGLLVGLGGAAQFEQITDFRDDKGHLGGTGTRGMGSQSLGHLLIMLLIVLGNLGFWAQKRLGSPPPAPLSTDPDEEATP